MSKKLIIKNFPTKFTDKDKHEFLVLFGGVIITCMHGKLKNCCFVEFDDIPSAQQGLEVLHQFELLGERLVAEYARSSHEKLANEIQSKTILEKKTFIIDKKRKQPTSTTNDVIETETVDSLMSGVAPNLGLNHTFPAHLHYKYPEPNVTILTNIANALASVPKFYTLVIHLMNKLNLPPPFTGPTPSPPLPDDKVNLQDACVDTSDLCNFASSEESELESDSENKKHEIYQHSNVSNTEPTRKRKRLRAAGTKNQEKLQIIKPKVDQPVESAFELGSTVKRLEFKLGDSIKDAVEKKSSPAVHFNVFDERGAFGKIEPLPKVSKVEEETNASINSVSDLPDSTIIQICDMSTNDESEEEEEEEDEEIDYITLKKIKESRKSRADILAMQQFKNYIEGNKTNRLYVKNIAKQATTEELCFIFKRFIRHCSEEEKLLFEIKHMKEGRMKGQAFVTFPNATVAEKALKTVHGFILQEKPMIIQYGKSTTK